jgi:hypothetical protein
MPIFANSDVCAAIKISGWSIDSDAAAKNASTVDKKT